MQALSLRESAGALHTEIVGHNTHKHIVTQYTEISLKSQCIKVSNNKTQNKVFIKPQYTEISQNNLQVTRLRNLKSQNTQKQASSHCLQNNLSSHNTQKQVLSHNTQKQASSHNTQKQALSLNTQKKV